MSFFDDLPEREPAKVPRWVDPDWRRIPHELVPAPLPLSELIHASDDTALVIYGASVYRQGFTFTLVATRHPEAAPPDVAMHEVLHGSAFGHGTMLRIGVLHEDGTRATFPPAEGERPPGKDGPPASISSRGGGGTQESSTVEHFVWPIPAAGDLTLLFRWDAVGLDEARVTIPGDALREAAARSREIWPGAQVPPPSQSGEGWSASSA